MIDCFGPGIEHLNYLAVTGVGIFEFLFVPVTTNHFPGWGISVIFNLTLLHGGREFDSNVLENVKSLSYALPLPSPHWLDIDRCMRRIINSVLHVGWLSKQLYFRSFYLMHHKRKQREKDILQHSHFEN